MTVTETPAATPQQPIPPVTPPAPPPAVTPPAAPVTPPVTPPAAGEAPVAPKTSSAVMDRMFNDIMGRKQKKTEPVTPTATPPAPAPAVAEPKANDEPAEPPKRKPIKRVLVKEKGEQLTPEQIADVAAQAAVKAVEANRPAPAAAPAPAAVQIPEMFKRNSDVYEALEQLYPEKYGNGQLVSQLADSAKRINDYRTTWESQNPGQKFVEKDHADEIAGLTPDISDDEVLQARIEVGVTKRLKPVQEKEAAREQDAQRARVQTEVAEVGRTANASVFDTVITEVDPEMLKLIKAKDESGIAKYREENADKVEVASVVAGTWAPIAQRAAELVSPGGSSIYNHQSQLDRQIVEQVLPQIAEQLVGTEDDNGKIYISPADYSKLSATQRAKHTVIDRDVIVLVISEHAKSEVKRVLEEKKKSERAILKRYGVDPDAKNESRPGQKPAPVTAQPTAQPAASKSVGIASPGGGPTIGGGAGGGSAPLSGRDRLVAGLFGRRP